MRGWDCCILVRLDYLKRLTALNVLFITIELLLGCLNTLAWGIIWDGPYLIFITIVRLMVSSHALSWLHFASHESCWGRWVYVPLSVVLSTIRLLRLSRVRSLLWPLCFVVVFIRFIRCAVIIIDTGSVVLLILTFILFVSVEVIEEQVIIFNSVLQMIHHFLFFIDIDAEATAFVEYVVFIIRAVVDFSRQATTAGKDQLAFSFERILPGIALSMITWLLWRISSPLLHLSFLLNDDQWCIIFLLLC